MTQLILKNTKKIKTATVNYFVSHVKSLVFFGLGIYWTVIVVSTFFVS